jgi:hypothetical protein
MPEKKLTPSEVLDAALSRFEQDPRTAAAALVESAVAKWGPKGAREIVPKLIDAAFIEEEAELRERAEILKRA